MKIKLSIEKLDEVDEKLKILVEEVSKISPIDFNIVEGIRTKEKQKELFEDGKSKTLNSKHLEGKAIDFCPYIAEKNDYEARDDLMFLCGLFYAKSLELNIKIRLGCIWENFSIKQNKFIDGYHVELV